MHEVAIAHSLIALIEQERARRGNVPVLGAGVRIGELSDINSDSLQFGYQCLVADTPLEKCGLSIERVPATGKCRECETTSRFNDLVFICPNCSGQTIELLSGQEIELAWLKIEESEKEEPADG